MNSSKTPKSKHETRTVVTTIAIYEQNCSGVGFVAKRLGLTGDLLSSKIQIAKCFFFFFFTHITTHFNYLFLAKMLLECHCLY